MFGPQSGKHGWSGLPFVFERVRLNNARCLGPPFRSTVTAVTFWLVGVGVAASKGRGGTAADF